MSKSTNFTKMTTEVTKINGNTEIKTTHHDNGEVKSKVPYVNGKKQGVATEWLADGTKYIAQMWMDGKKQGVETWWWDNGMKRRELMYRDGKQHGLDRWWWDNGKNLSKTTWVDGKQHGLLISMSEKGMKRWQQMWANDKRHGVETEWYENGQKEWQAYSSFGVTFARIDWDEEGNVFRSDFSPKIKKQTYPSNQRKTR